MSSDGASATTPAAPVMFVELGDYQLMLRPVDQKSSANIILAQNTVSTINMARELLTERGPFLVQERQQRMENTVKDAEEAINSVVKLLKPARIQPVGEESFQINPKNAWPLASDPKAAATFGRLEQTHSRLRTVLHDLENIEATGTLDTCEARATTLVHAASVSQPSSSASNVTSQPPGNNLLAWRRSRASRQKVPIRGPTPEDMIGIESHDSGGRRQSSVGISEHVPQQPRHANTDSSTSGGSVAGADKASAERLDIIHELDASSHEKPQAAELASSVPPLSKDEDVAMPSSPVTTRSGQIDTSTVSEISADAVPVTAEPVSISPTKADLITVPSPPIMTEIAPVERTTFSKYRRRGRETWQAQQSDGVSSPSSTRSPQVPGKPAMSTIEESQPRKIHTEQANSLQRNVSQPEAQPEENAIQCPPDMKKALDVVMAKRFLAQSQVAQQDQHTGISDRSSAVTSTEVENHSNGSFTNPSTQPNRMLMTEASPTVEMRPHEPKSHQHTETSQPPPQIVLPTRVQNHPSTQITSPVSHFPPEFRKPEVILVDSELSRVPSALRAGHVKRPQRPPPYPITEGIAEDLHSSDSFYQPQTQSAVEPRPITAPVPRSNARHTHPAPQPAPSNNVIHKRFFSDTEVPQISIQRVPTVPRKPLPFRNHNAPGGMSESPTGSDVSPAPSRPQSEIIGAISSSSVPTLQNISPPVVSPFEDPENLLATEPDNNSSISLNVQDQLFVGSSARSSITDSDAAQRQPSPLSNTPRGAGTNPLTMHPPDARMGLPSMTRPESTPAILSQSPSSTQYIDYSSPAFQQTRWIPPPNTNFQQHPPMSNALQSTNRLPPQPDPSQPVRRSTAPLAGTEPASPVPDNGPRRASEHLLQSTWLNQQEHLRNPPHPQGPPPPPPTIFYTQATTPPTPRVYQAPQYLQKQVDPRTVNARSAPPANPRPTLDVLSTVISNRGGSVNHAAGTKNKSDRELFGRSDFRARADEQVLSPQSPQNQLKHRQTAPAAPQQQANQQWPPWEQHQPPRQRFYSQANPQSFSARQLANMQHAQGLLISPPFSPQQQHYQHRQQQPPTQVQSPLQSPLQSPPQSPPQAPQTDQATQPQQWQQSLPHYRNSTYPQPLPLPIPSFPATAATLAHQERKKEKELLKEVSKLLQTPIRPEPAKMVSDPGPNTAQKPKKRSSFGWFASGGEKKLAKSRTICP